MSRPFFKIPKVLQNDTKAGDAPDAYGAAIAFDKICETVDIFLWDKPAMVKRSRDGVNWDDEFEVPADSMYSIDCKTHSVKIENKTPTEIARYQFVGWF